MIGQLNSSGFVPVSRMFDGCFTTSSLQHMPEVVALALDESEQWLFSASADKVGKHSSRDTCGYLHNTHAAKDGCRF